MMRGTNTLRLNHATLQEAIQEWLDKRVNVSLVGLTEVTDVSYDNGKREFVITVSEKGTGK